MIAQASLKLKLYILPAWSTDSIKRLGRCYCVIYKYPRIQTKIRIKHQKNERILSQCVSASSGESQISNLRRWRCTRSLPHWYSLSIKMRHDSFCVRDGEVEQGVCGVLKRVGGGPVRQECADEKHSDPDSRLGCLGRPRISMSLLLQSKKGLRRMRFCATRLFRDLILGASHLADYTGIRVISYLRKVSKQPEFQTAELARGRRDVVRKIGRLGNTEYDRRQHSWVLF